jgi:hypothetical protein
MSNEYERRGGSHRMDDLEAEALKRQQSAKSGTSTGADQPAANEVAQPDAAEKTAK